jgi:hypothetical protein
MPSRKAHGHEKTVDYVARHSLALGVFASPWVANPRKGRVPPLATAFGGSAFGLGGYGFFLCPRAKRTGMKKPPTSF